MLTTRPFLHEVMPRNSTSLLDFAVRDTYNYHIKHSMRLNPKKIKVDGASFSDAGSLVTTAHVTREICPRDLKYRKSKANMAAQKLLLTRCFFLSVRDWIKTKVVSC